MTLELFFVGGSFVVGVTQMAEARILLRDQGRLTRAVAVTSSLEFAWTLFCVYLLVTGSLEFARWLAVVFLAYMVVGTIVGYITGRRAGLDPTPRTPDIDPVLLLRFARLGTVFGAAFAAAALILLAT